MLRIGASGFSYDDWRGTWYPPGLPRARMLEAYAEVFDALEVNVTYYRTPPPGAAASMVRRAGGRLAFSVKAPGDLTHRRRLDGAIVTPWLQFLDPLREAGVLEAALLQFPYAFHDRPAERRFLQDAARTLEGLPLVVEFRHASWDGSGTEGLLANLGVSRAAVDQPALPGLSSSGREPFINPVAYFRFHGRNEGQWFVHEEAADRYRYRYRREELEAWAPRVRQAADRAQTTLAFFNNHPDGAAPRDAETLAAILEHPLRGEGYRDLFS